VSQRDSQLWDTSETAVFDNDAAIRRHTETCGRVEEKVRCRFAGRYFCGAEDSTFEPRIQSRDPESTPKLRV